MKKLIGLLVIIFIATSVSQVFAQDVLKDINKNTTFCVKAPSNIDSASYAKDKLTEFLFNRGVKVVTDETKADFILEISSVIFDLEIWDPSHIEMGIDLIERSSSKLIAHHDIEQDVRVSSFFSSKTEAIGLAINQLNSDSDVMYFLDHTKN